MKDWNAGLGLVKSVFIAWLMTMGPGHAQKTGEHENAIRSIEAIRSAKNPLITFDSCPSLGRNINGPSVIRVPSWVRKPLGKYYMYFAHHAGEHIRLAYADDIHGPWKIHKPGTLQMGPPKVSKDHIASPDVHVDDKEQRIRMYFHRPAQTRKGQWTYVALSKDGLEFEASETILGKFYFRAFEWMNMTYAIAKKGDGSGGLLYRSTHNLEPFEVGRDFVEKMRHAAVLVHQGHLLIFYSRIGDDPERILVSTVKLTDDWNEWVVSEPMEVIQPERDYEGMAYPAQPSKSGAAIEVRQLRDPCIYTEEGRFYLFYSYAGEMGIAMAELKIEMR
jgi:hypothetical protein